MEGHTLAVGHEHFGFARFYGSVTGGTAQAKVFNWNIHTKNVVQLCYMFLCPEQLCDTTACSWHKNGIVFSLNRHLLKLNLSVCLGSRYDTMLLLCFLSQSKTIYNILILSQSIHVNGIRCLGISLNITCGIVSLFWFLVEKYKSGLAIDL